MILFLLKKHRVFTLFLLKKRGVFTLILLKKHGVFTLYSILQCRGGSRGRGLWGLKPPPSKDIHNFVLQTPISRYHSEVGQVLMDCFSVSHIIVVYNSSTINWGDSAPYIATLYHHH